MPFIRFWGIYSWMIFPSFFPFFLSLSLSFFFFTDVTCQSLVQFLCILLQSRSHGSGGSWTRTTRKRGWAIAITVKIKSREFVRPSTVTRSVRWCALVWRNIYISCNFLVNELHYIREHSLQAVFFTVDKLSNDNTKEKSFGMARAVRAQ